jgi:dihydrofolate reductase
MMSFDRRAHGVCLVVAYAKHRVIGRDGAMPWHLPEDLKHFRSLTLDASIVMGRQIFESIGKALPRRRNIVITRNPSWRCEGAVVATNFEQALALAAPGEVYVIGGGQIYQIALAHADRAVVTEIELEVAGDTYFPELAVTCWEEVAHIKGLSNQGLSYRFIDYRRIKS